MMKGSPPASCPAIKLQQPLLYYSPRFSAVLKRPLQKVVEVASHINASREHLFLPVPLRLIRKQTLAGVTCGYEWMQEIENNFCGLRDGPRTEIQRAANLWRR